MQSYLAAGYTVVTSDYEGEGLDWAAGQESGDNTLDGIRAAENALNAGRSTQVGMVGYSGGSIATEWASELAPGYAPDLHIIGAAEGGIPVDFAHNLTYVNGDTDGWAGVIPADFLKDPTFASVINNLTMGTSSTHPAEPLLMAVGNSDGTGDGVMVAADDEALAHKYCDEGVPVTFTEYQKLDHEETIAPFEATALAFLEARFAGTPDASGCASIGNGSSLAPLPVSSTVQGSTGQSCPVATGKLSGDTLGLVHLGMTRAQARRAYTHSSNHGKGYEDFFCLSPVGVRVGYASPKLLNSVPSRQRPAHRGRVVWASTSDILYAVNGVRPGTAVNAARKQLKLGKPFHVGLNFWYLAASGRATAVLKVHRGTIEEIGIADKRLTQTRAADRVFLRSFS